MDIHILNIYVYIYTYLYMYIYIYEFHKKLTERRLLYAFMHMHPNSPDSMVDVGHSYCDISHYRF